jgi:hypothetical protein
LPVGFGAACWLAVSPNGKLACTGNAATGGRLTGYRVAGDGSLEQVTSVPASAGLTGAAAG